MAMAPASGLSQISISLNLHLKQQLIQSHSKKTFVSYLPAKFQIIVRRNWYGLKLKFEISAIHGHEWITYVEIVLFLCRSHNKMARRSIRRRWIHIQSRRPSPSTFDLRPWPMAHGVHDTLPPHLTLTISIISITSNSFFLNYAAVLH